jgi:hypothetical protein
MVIGELTFLTPEGEEMSITEVTVTTDGVVATVTMVTGTLEDFDFPADDAPIADIGTPSPEGTDETLVSIVLILGDCVVPDPPDPVSINGAVAVAAAPDLTAGLVINGTPVTDPAAELPVKDTGRVVLTTEVEAPLLEEILFSRDRRLFNFKALAWRERNLFHCAEDHPLHKGHG